MSEIKACKVVGKIDLSVHVCTVGGKKAKREWAKLLKEHQQRWGHVPTANYLEENVKKRLE